MLVVPKILSYVAKILETDYSNVKPNSIKEVKVKSRDLLTKSDSLRKEMICTTSGNRRFRVFFNMLFTLCNPRPLPFPLLEYP